MASGAAVGMSGGNGFIGSSSTSWFQINNGKKKDNMGRDRVKMSCAASSVTDSYQTLKIQPGASESDVRKAYRQLALRYHPDVCRGNNCGVQFSSINEAYDIVMRNLREGEVGTETLMTWEEEGRRGMYDEGASDVEAMRGIYDEWDEEWMGWEGGPIATYKFEYYNPYS